MVQPVPTGSPNMWLASTCLACRVGAGAAGTFPRRTAMSDGYDNSELEHVPDSSAEPVSADPSSVEDTTRTGAPAIPSAWAVPLGGQPEPVGSPTSAPSPTDAPAPAPTWPGTDDEEPARIWAGPSSAHSGFAEPRSDDAGPPTGRR